jgi:hypothetical protein
MIDNNIELIEHSEHSEPFDEPLKDIIVELIYKKMAEVESNGFKPKFVVLNRKSYASLVAYIMETGVYVAEVGCRFPTTIFELPIVMVGDNTLDVKILSDANHEFQYQVREDYKE